MSDETCLFAVVVTLEGPNYYSHPYFVRAATMPDAYIAILDQNRSLFHRANVRFEGYVIGAGEFPDAKRIAKAWWDLAYKNAGAAPPGSANDFEDLWAEHGADPDPEDT